MIFSRILFLVLTLLLSLGACQSTKMEEPSLDEVVEGVPMDRLILQPMSPLSTTQWLPAAHRFNVLVAENSKQNTFDENRYEIVGWDMNHDKQVDMVDVYERKTGDLSFSVYRHGETWKKILPK